MKETLVISEIGNPIGKYAVFSGIVSLFKGTVQQRQNIVEYGKVKKHIYFLEHGKEWQYRDFSPPIAISL